LAAVDSPPCYVLGVLGSGGSSVGEPAGGADAVDAGAGALGTVPPASVETTCLVVVVRVGAGFETGVGGASSARAPVTVAVTSTAAAQPAQRRRGVGIFIIRSMGPIPTFGHSNWRNTYDSSARRTIQFTAISAPNFGLRGFPLVASRRRPAGGRASGILHGRRSRPLTVSRAPRLSRGGRRNAF
jgi:hypothetical protein